MLRTPAVVVLWLVVVLAGISGADYFLRFWKGDGAGREPAGGRALPEVARGPAEAGPFGSDAPLAGGYCTSTWSPFMMCVGGVDHPRGGGLLADRDDGQLAQDVAGGRDRRIHDL